MYSWFKEVIIKDLDAQVDCNNILLKLKYCVKCISILKNNKGCLNTKVMSPVCTYLPWPER